MKQATGFLFLFACDEQEFIADLYFGPGTYCRKIHSAEIQILIHFVNAENKERSNENTFHSIQSRQPGRIPVILKTGVMNGYHFITHWHLAATCEEVYRTLEDVESLARWWPSVYLDVRVLEKGRAGGVGKVVELYTKGWLPYTLRWKFQVTETNFPNGDSLEAVGDFVGKGVWTFRPLDDGRCEVAYDWKITAEKPLLKLLTPLLRPLFSANHHWAMRIGEKSLKLELKRQRAKTEEERTSVPAPPGPTFPHNLTRNKLMRNSCFPVHPK